MWILQIAFYPSCLHRRRPSALAGLCYIVKIASENCILRGIALCVGLHRAWDRIVRRITLCVGSHRADWIVSCGIASCGLYRCMGLHHANCIARLHLVDCSGITASWDWTVQIDSWNRIVKSHREDCIVRSHCADCIVGLRMHPFQPFS